MTTDTKLEIFTGAALAGAGRLALSAAYFLVVAAFVLAGWCLWQVNRPDERTWAEQSHREGGRD